jgi:DNA-binding beta-propeller fold protein YncE
MRRGLARACAVLLALAACAPPAAAEGPNHPLLDAITVGPPTAEQLKDACGVAVDSKGYVYVSSYYHHAIYIFSKQHAYVAQIANVDPLDGPIKEPLDGPCDLAFDSADNLYVNNWHRDVVKFTPSPPGSTNYKAETVIDANHPTSVAVDPATDRVYVDDRTYVAVYEPSGLPVLSGAEPLRIGLGSLGDGYGVAVSGFPATKGQVYVADAADETVKVYDPAADPLAPVRAINGAGTPQGTFYLADSDLAVNPSDGHLYVTDSLQPSFEHPELAVDELSVLGHYRGRLPYATTEGGPTFAVNARPSAVAVSNEEIFVTSGNDFVANGSYRGAEVLVFGPAPMVATQILTVARTGAGTGTVARVPSGWLRCGAACDGEFDRGATVKLAATPDPHNRLVGWSGCESNPTAGTCFVRMETDVSVGAEFEPIPQRSLGVTRIGAGTVTSSPAGIDCGASCEGDFDEASTVILAANAAEGSRLVAWSGCDSEPTADTCAVTMSAARLASAEFGPIPEPPPPSSPEPGQRMLTIAATGIGTATGTVTSEPAGIDCGGACAHLYNEGSAVTLAAHPALGSSFLGWGGCDSTSGERCTVMLGADKTVVVAFSPGFPGRLRLRGLRVEGATAILEVGVPVPGALSAAGKALRPASAIPLTAGPVSLRLRLSRSGRRALHRAKSRRLAVTVALALTPFDGGTTVQAAKTIIFLRGPDTQSIP